MRLQRITGCSSTGLETYREVGAEAVKLTFGKTVPSVDGNVCPHQSLSRILKWWKNQNRTKTKTSTRVLKSDHRGGEAADQGDAAEAHLPEEGGANGLHDKVLQKNSQLCEQGAGVETDRFNTRLGHGQGHSEVLLHSDDINK